MSRPEWEGKARVTRDVLESLAPEIQVFNPEGGCKNVSPPHTKQQGMSRPEWVDKARVTEDVVEALVLEIQVFNPEGGCKNVSPPLPNPKITRGFPGLRQSIALG